MNMRIKMNLFGKFIYFFFCLELKRISSVWVLTQSQGVDQMVPSSTTSQSGLWQKRRKSQCIVLCKKSRIWNWREGLFPVAFQDGFSPSFILQSFRWDKPTNYDRPDVPVWFRSSVQVSSHLKVWVSLMFGFLFQRKPNESFLDDFFGVSLQRRYHRRNTNNTSWYSVWLWEGMFYARAQRSHRSCLCCLAQWCQR